MTPASPNPYKERYPLGTPVRIADRDALDAFQQSWTLHHPLSDEQLEHAGETATVSDFGFYHGGDVLYWLTGKPGTWHEVCLASADPHDP
jgi:hypothetical protein